jgi:predicted DNA-binding protein YlxM (UPF0122 family)
MRTSEIKDLVEGELGYRIDKNSRERHIVYGRAIYFRICKDRTNLSLQRIGETLNVHHATVLHALRNIFPSFEMYNPKYMDIYNRIIETEEYIPKYKKLKILQEQHRKLETRFRFLKELKIDPKLKPILQTIQELPEEKFYEAEKRIKGVLDRLQEYCE